MADIESKHRRNVDFDREAETCSKPVDFFHILSLLRDYFTQHFDLVAERESDLLWRSRRRLSASINHTFSFTDQVWEEMRKGKKIKYYKSDKSTTLVNKGKTERRWSARSGRVKQAMCKNVYDTASINSAVSIPCSSH